MSLLSYFGKKSGSSTESDQPAEQHGASSSDVAEEPPRKKQCSQLTVSEKGSFTRPNSHTRKSGRRNILGSSVMILVKACFVSPARSGVSL